MEAGRGDFSRLYGDIQVIAGDTYCVSACFMLIALTRSVTAEALGAEAKRRSIEAALQSSRLQRSERKSDDCSPDEGIFKPL